MKLVNSVQESAFLKVMSFLLASILWITTLCFRSQETKQDVRIEILLPLGMRILNRVPSQIQFGLSGSRIMLEDAKARIQPIRIDLTKNRESTVGFSITEDLIGELPEGLRVVSISPPQILVQLSKD